MTYPISSTEPGLQQRATALGWTRLNRIFTGRWATLKIAALAFVLTLPAIALGMFADDYVLALNVVSDPFSAYTFRSVDPAARVEELLAQRAAGECAWWIDLSFHQAFFRPLSSLSLALDFRVWPQAVWFMHVENGLLYAAIALLVGLLYRQLGLSPQVLGLGTFFYATNSSHAMTTSFISSRNTLLSTVFGLLALWLYVRAKQPDGSAQRGWLQAGSVLMFGLALLSGEGGLAIGGYLVSHACTLEAGQDKAQGPRPLARRLLALWPYALLACGWQWAYRSGGYGAEASAFYRDPDDDPLGVLLGVLTGIPIYFASQLTLPYASLSGISPSALALATLVSLVLLYSLRGLLLPLLRSDRRARFFALGAALAAVPLGTTLAQDRLVVFISFGISGLLAQVITQRLDAHNLELPRAGARRLFYLHALVGPLLFVPGLFGWMTNAVGGGAIALERALPRDAAHGVLLINGPSHLPVYFQRLMRERAGVQTVPFIDMLYAGSSPIQLWRSAERSLELQVDRGYMATILERHANDLAKHPFRQGQTIDTARLHITVLEVNEDGAPTRVRFDFGFDLDDGQVLPMIWEGHEPKPWRLPAVGQRVELAGVPPI
jgi:hypothetical protein